MKYRASGFLVMGVLTLAALGLYLVKYRVQDVTLEVAAAEDALAKERESLHLLSAEWAYLNRPDRLEALAQKYLTLAPLQSTQFVAYDALPEASAEGESAPGEGAAFFQPVGGR